MVDTSIGQSEEVKDDHQRGVSSAYLMLIVSSSALPEKWKRF